MLAKDELNAICAGPFGTIFKAHDFRPQGVPIIFLRHVSEGRYLTHKPGFMDPKRWEELFQPYSVYGGELLVTKLGDPPGVAAIYPEGTGPAMVTPDVIKMSVDSRLADTRWVMYYLNSHVGRKVMFGAAFGTTRMRVTLPIFRSTAIPLPPREEQEAAVAEIERHFSDIDATENYIAASLKRASRLRQSILKEAFAGRLVPQDPNDEPASILLDRIGNSVKSQNASVKRRTPEPRQKELFE
jgi:type I restriction enzyme S subunit